MMTFGLEALASASGRKFGLPSFPFFIFGVIGLLGSAGDYRMMRVDGLRGVPRLRRHLWRMCTALTITAGSFFSIRARVATILPEPFLSPGARTIPVVFVLFAMCYWLWRVRTKRHVAWHARHSKSRRPHRPPALRQPAPSAPSAAAPRR